MTTAIMILREHKLKLIIIFVSFALPYFRIFRPPVRAMLPPVNIKMNKKSFAIARLWR